jgi:hypothetical protein
MRREIHDKREMHCSITNYWVAISMFSYKFLIERKETRLEWKEKKTLNIK